jgi:hypothetical protein
MSLMRCIGRPPAGAQGAFPFGQAPLKFSHLIRGNTRDASQVVSNLIWSAKRTFHGKLMMIVIVRIGMLLLLDLSTPRGFHKRTNLKKAQQI